LNGRFFLNFEQILSYPRKYINFDHNLALQDNDRYL
jgi:hypothetical protein